MILCNEAINKSHKETKSITVTFIMNMALNALAV